LISMSRNFGDELMARVNNTHNLRYRLLPFTYSLFYDVYANGRTVQRHLVFDFPSDPTVFTISDEFTWGGTILVAPFVTATDSANNRRDVYLPGGPGEWVDFWLGQHMRTGKCLGWIEWG